MFVGSALAMLAVGEPWLVPRLIGGLFFRWHELATVVVILGLLATAILTRRLAAASLQRCLLGATIASLQMGSLRVGPINLLNICIALLVWWWMLDLARTAREPRETPALAHLLMAFAVLGMISVWGEQQSPRGLIALLPKLVMAGIVMRMLRTEADLLFAIRVLVVTSLVSALLGIAQSAAFFFASLELNLMEDDSPRFITVFGFNFVRASGMLSNPQAYCHALTAGFFLLTYGWIAGTNRFSRWNPLVWGGLLVLAAALILSFARGPWAAIVIGLVVLPAVAWPRWAIHWFVLLGLLSLAGMSSGALTSVLSAYRSFTLTNTEVRVELMATGLQVVAQHPWRGVGLTNFAFYSPALERFPVHNSVIQVATETGIPGVLVFLAIMLTPVFQALRAVRVASTRNAHLLRAMLLAYIVYLVEIQGEPGGYSELLFFSAAFLSAMARIAGGAPVTSLKPPLIPMPISMPRSLP